jgi:hypothetical protein
LIFIEENLKHLYLTKNGNFINSITKKLYYYHYNCKKCGYPYLGTKESEYCSHKCMANTDEFKNRMSLVNKNNTHTLGTILTFDHRKKISGTLRNNTGGYAVDNLPKYDLYAPQLEPYEQCRRNDDDPNILEVKCTYCGKWYVPTRHSTKHRINGISENDNSRFYCSSGCKIECPLFSANGNRINYKGKEGHNSREVQPELRQLTFDRDAHVCIKCGSTGPLHCHHIDPVISNPIESADIDNCITLCKDCHKEAHKLPGCRYIDLRRCI